MQFDTSNYRRVSWKQWSRWTRLYFCLHKHKARDGKRHPNITHSDGQWPAIQVAHRKMREQQPSLFFSGSQQAKRHKVKGELQWGRQRKEIREKLKFGGQREEQHGNRKRTTAVPESSRLLIEIPRSPTHSPSHCWWGSPPELQYSWNFLLLK